MNEEFNIYCDESCHLENDGINVMTLGAIWCPKDSIKEINREIKDIKINNGISKNAEIKWAKVSPSKINLYLDLINYFFSRNDLHFRVLIVPDKSILRHKLWNQTHDDFYYKMYFNLIKVIWEHYASYNVYLDIKDTNGGIKNRKLHEVLCNHHYDYTKNIINKVQQIRSHEVEIIQLTDLLIGAVTYENRNLKSSKAKLTIINRIKEITGFSLSKTTYLTEQKFNIFRWESNCEL